MKPHEVKASARGASSPPGRKTALPADGRRPKGRSIPRERRRWTLAALPLALLAAWVAYLLLADSTGDEAVSPDAQASVQPTEAPPDAAPSPGSLAGRVTDDRGQPVAGATVVAEDGEGGLHPTESDGAGAFRLALAPGTYLLAARLDARAADPLGPLPLGPGEELRDLVLRLVPGARLSGRVLDERRREPVASAIVTLVGTPFSTIADKDGRFALTAPAGEAALRVMAEGYLPRRLPLHAAAGHAAGGLDIYLRQATRLAGIVVGPDGEPLPGAALWIWRYQATASKAPALAPLGPQSGPDGRFEVDVAAGVCRLLARAQGFAEGRTRQLDLAVGQRVEGLRVALGRGGEIDGIVLLPTGAPVTAGQVQALGGPEGWPVARTDVDRGGHFQLTEVPAGRVTVVADAAQARGSAETQLEEGGQAQVEIRLGDGSIEGTVVDGETRPVAGALVVARPVASRGAGERSSLSGADGRFRLTGLSGERFDVAASKDDGSAEVKGVARGSHDVDLSLAVGSASGWVQSPDSAGVSDFRLSAEPEVPGHGRPRSTRGFDGRGEFKIVLAPGSYTLRASAPGYADGEARDVTIAPGQETSGLRIDLRPSGTIDGVVLEAQSGAPLVGIHLAIDRGHSWAVGMAQSGGGQGATTGADGRFLLRDVPPGNWPIFASSPDFELVGNPPQVSVAVGADAPPVEIHMRRANAQREQAYAGIGMSMWDRGGHKRAAEVFAGGPAAEAGIHSGDEILAIDSEPAQSLSLQALVSKIRGPVGTEITLDMQRANDGPTYEVVVPRADIKLF